MKITLFMATSLNGIIARSDYREDFLTNKNWFSFLNCVRQKGALIWGRKTQEKARRYSPQAFDEMQDFRKIVVSTNPAFTLEEGFELASSPQNAIAKLSNHGCQEAILSGGAILNSSFAKAQLIDEVIINIQDVIIGKGIPVFNPEEFDLHLRYKELKQVNEKILQLHYQVIKS